MAKESGILNRVFSVFSCVGLSSPVFLLNSRIILFFSVFSGSSEGKKKQKKLDCKVPLIYKVYIEFPGLSNHRMKTEKTYIVIYRVCSDLMYRGCAFPLTTSWLTSTATISECGTSNIGSSSSFSY